MSIPSVPYCMYTDELLEKLQEVADEFDAAVDTTPEPSALEKRNALIKRALAVIPLVRVRKQTSLHGYVCVVHPS